MAYESPKYQVSRRLGTSVEIREYEPYLVAQVAVDGNLENAGNAGFRILAAYIFGKNRGARRVAMTGAVTQEPQQGQTKISMTSPVSQQRGDEGYIVQFMMPSDYSLETLPEPEDDRIEIREVPGRTLAAIRYSGRWSKSRYQEHFELLMDALDAAELRAVGNPIWARYDPPFKPWFMRRNEILTEFEAKH